MDGAGRPPPTPGTTVALACRRAAAPGPIGGIVHNMLGKNETATEAQITARVVADAKRFHHDLAEDVVEQCARQAVTELWTGSIKVTTFVPLLALRRVRETLAAEDPCPVASGETAAESSGTT